MTKKGRVELRKDEEDRKNYNDVVWEKVLKTEMITKKLKNIGYKFHHEIMTDGVSVSLLYSKVTQHERDIGRGMWNSFR